MSFSLVDELEENIVDGSTDKCSKIEEFAIYSMERRFEEVSFTRVLAVE